MTSESYNVSITLEGSQTCLQSPSHLQVKDPDAGKDWGQEKGMTEDEMVGWHHRLNGHEFEQTLGDSEGQGSRARCKIHGFTKSWTLLSDWITKQLQETTGQLYHCRVTFIESHINRIYTCAWLLLLNITLLRFNLVFACINIHSFHCWKLPHCVDIRACLLILLLMDIWVASSLGLLWIKLLWILV